jgi:formylglycine-generating enzyme required for sulfatase activity/serine/threonine protein kinase
LSLDPKRVEEVFSAALQKGSPDERAAFLEAACGGDVALRGRVDALLHAHAEASDFLGRPAVEQLAAAPPDPTEALAPSGDGGGVIVADPDAPAAGQQGEEESVLDFLQPPGKPDSLGRLGHYEVLEVLGRGGFGIVLKAFDEMLHRVVAIKVMAPHLASTSPARKRFLREARASAAIRHENVVGIHAVEEQPIPYLVMEYIAGETLQQQLNRLGPFEVPEILRIGQQVARGLAAAHALGLVHRDIKPSNILLESGIEQRAKITDFGLARAADDASLTQSGYIAGTPMYMAPEQALGQPIDHRADLFSLGSVLYVMCSGRPPFRASTTLAVLKRATEDTPRPIREIIPEIPEWLCAVIARLHAKKPEDRFASAKEVADLLARCQSELQRYASVLPLPIALQTVPGPTLPASKPVRGSRPHTEGSPPPAPTAAGGGKRRLRWLTPLAGGAALLAVLGLVGFLLVQGLRPPRGEAPAAPQAPLDPKAPVVFRALANQPWQDTGVDVVEAEPVILAPKGSWRKGQQTCSAGGLEPAPRERAVWPEAPLLCLLVRIGDEPTPAAVRQREVFKPKRSGRLFVQANDLDLEGNGDALQLTITGGLCLGDAAPAPALLPAQAADRDWKPILARADAPRARPDPVREEALDYCQKYAGTPYVSRATPLLLKLPPLVNSVGMMLAPIPPGKFLMGSPDDDPGRRDHEGPQHEVVLTRPFYIGVHDVTVGQFRAFVKESGYQTEAEASGEGAVVFTDSYEAKLDPKANWAAPGFEQTDDHPAVCVSWNDARAFCDWLSKKEGKTYALPTEAQWEYACRAGSKTKFYFGDDEQELGQYAWYDANAERKTHPVGQLRANAWGLFDMHGNVWQWTADWFAADYYQKSPREDPPGPATGSTRALRGGGWNIAPFACRSAYRVHDHGPSVRTTHIGFRVVLLR